MTESKRALLSRIGIEFFIVVFGILVALAVDDWRQARDDRALEIHLPTSLADDLEFDRRDAELQARLVQGHLDPVDHILTLANHPLAPAVSARGEAGEDIDRSLLTLWHMAELQVFDSTYTEMLSTGSIRVIRNRDLRRLGAQPDA